MPKFESIGIADDRQRLAIGSEHETHDGRRAGANRLDAFAGRDVKDLKRIRQRLLLGAEWWKPAAECGELVVRREREHRPIGVVLLQFGRGEAFDLLCFRRVDRKSTRLNSS